MIAEVHTLEKKVCRRKFFISPPVPRKIIRSFSNDDVNGDDYEDVT